MIPLYPSRSPLLQALPPAPPPRSLVRRALWIALGGATVGGLYLAIVTDRMPASLAPRMLWLHDRVYLPLKGYLLTQGYPWSLGPWLGLVLLMALACLALLARRPLTPGWHVRLTRHTLRQPWSHPGLRDYCRRFRSLALAFERWTRRAQNWPGLRRFLPGWRSWMERPPLIEEVIDHARQEALAELDGVDLHGPTSTRILHPAIRLSLLSAQVLAPPPRHPDDPLRAVVRLNQALLRLELIRIKVGSAMPTATQELRSTLRREISARLLPRFPVRPGPPDFSLPRLVADLASVLDLPRPSGWERDQAEERRILEGIEARRLGLDRSRRQLERWSAFGHRRGAPAPAAATLEVAGSWVAARLGLDLALYTGLRGRTPAVALAFVESFDVFRLLLSVLETELVEAAPLVEAAAGLPDPFDYRICTHLQEMRLAAEDLASPSEGRSDGVQRADLELELARQRELGIAAGDLDLAIPQP